MRRHDKTTTLRRKLWITLVTLACAFSLNLTAAFSQNPANVFNSGSTGADGAFAPTASMSIAVPDGGVFNYTTVNIPANITITFTRNAKNTPVTILASGDVTIDGTVVVAGKPGNANGSGGFGGPGGFNGGTGGYGIDTFAGIAGDGPGAGGGGGSLNGTNVGGGGGGGFAKPGADGAVQNASTVVGKGGSRYASSLLLPLVGGSGGGGGGTFANAHGGGGGGGGGAIMIASSTTIKITGSIDARGGAGAFGFDQGAGGGGAGGAIRLVANTLTGTGNLLAGGGGGGGTNCCNKTWFGGTGAPGYVRLETFDFTSYNPNIDTIASVTTPNPVTLPTAPQIKIASVAGIAAPASTIGSLQGAPDVLVPTAQTNPVDVVIQASNVPIGTVVQVTVIPARGPQTTFTSSPLSGTVGTSTATASITLPTGVCALAATATVDITAIAQGPTINGEPVNKVEIAATSAGGSEMTYITKSGKRVVASRLR